MRLISLSSSKIFNNLARPSDELSDFNVCNTTKTWPRPHFHVLVDARQHHDNQRGLCRTLLSAVVQGYPPPILVGYRSEEGGYGNNERFKNAKVSSTESFLNAALDAIRDTKTPQHPSDEAAQSEQKQKTVILFLGQQQWVQMPAEVTVRRYLQHKDVFLQRLKTEYALLSSSYGINFMKERQNQTQYRKDTYTLGILFPASRRKSRLESRRRKNGNHINDKTEKEMDGSQKPTSSHYKDSTIEDQDDTLPESSLPEDVYGVFTDAGTFPRWWRKRGHERKKEAVPTRHQRPRYLGGGSFIGDVEDVERLLRGAAERVGWLGDDGRHEESVDVGGDELTYLFGEMFFEQEVERRGRQREESMNQRGKKGWWSGIWNGMNNADQADHPDGEEGFNNPNEYEFSIGLDYESRILQDMAEHPDSSSSDNNTTTPVTTDIRFLTFTRPNLVKTPSRTAAHLYTEPLRLPPELLHPFSPGGKSSPFGLTTTRYNLSEILKAAAQVVGNEQPNKGQPTEMTMISWPNLELATNVVVPRGSVPSILDMARVFPPENPEENMDKYWARMWFHQQKHDSNEDSYTPAKDLLNEYLLPSRYIYALEAAEGGKNWWNLRGGRGGLWTDQGKHNAFIILYTYHPLSRGMEATTKLTDT